MSNPFHFYQPQQGHGLAHNPLKSIYQTIAAEPILRAGGPASYFGISNDTEFEMARPTFTAK